MKTLTKSSIPVLIAEISLRGEDGTASSHRFSDGGE
jgi:hypothetical protein